MIFALGLFVTMLQVPHGPDCWSDTTTVPPAEREAAARAPRTLTAVPVATPPHIDGRLDDSAWCGAPLAGDFVQSSPHPGALATLPSLVRVVFDNEALYVAVRMVDPRPDSIVAPFVRRDDETNSDWAFIELDTRFDRRSGFSFGVNPRGIKVDGTWTDDVDFDTAWNGVWTAGVQVDSLGWTAEFRIPFSQLPLGRGTAGAAMTWGLNVYRYSPHRGESSNWSPRLPDVVGVISHFNRLLGLRVPAHASGLELVPFTAVRARYEPGSGDAGSATATAGGDVRIRPTPNSSVAAAILPDFGQVEADPASVNLTTFETYLTEQRPLFTEGNQLFRFPSALAFSSRGTSFDREEPFYSRRIGSAPHGTLPDGSSATHVPGATEVLGALRVSGRLGPWSGGLFHAWTQRERVVVVDTAGRAHSMNLEPLTHFTTLRASRDLGDARGELGGIVTLVGRPGMSGRMDSSLARTAVVAGIEGRHRLGNDRFELSGFALASRVAGSAAAIHRLRLAPRHGYGRPTQVGPVPTDPDSSATSLAGTSLQVRLAQIAGALQWGLTGRRVSRGFEMNDLGFQRNADWLLATANWRYRVYRPGHTIRRWSIGSDQVGYAATTAGERRSAVANLVLSGDLANYWGGSVTVLHEFAARDPEVLRGGPALLLPGQDRVTLTAYTDARRRRQLSLTTTVRRTPATGSHGWSIQPELSGFASDRLQFSISPLLASTDEAWQFVAAATDAADARRYLLGNLHQETAALTARLGYAFSPRLTLQLYAQAFVSGGAYDAFAEVADPTAGDPEQRVVPVDAGRISRDRSAGTVVVDPGDSRAVTFADPDFSERSAHVNLLLRWEFRPGSTLFLAWTQVRADDLARPFALSQELHRLWRTPTAHAVELKVSYWLAP